MHIKTKVTITHLPPHCEQRSTLYSVNTDGHFTEKSRAIYLFSGDTEVKPACSKLSKFGIFKGQKNASIEKVSI